MNRKPPHDRHHTPRWTAPRALAATRRKSPQRARIETAFAVMKASYAACVVAFGEGLGVRPLMRSDRTHLVWERLACGVGWFTHNGVPSFAKARLICVQEGTPLCN
jgi:hypothetical protein